MSRGKRRADVTRWPATMQDGQALEQQVADAIAADGGAGGITLDGGQLLGRLSPGTGPAEAIPIGAGLELVGGALRAVPQAVGYWSALTTGGSAPELIFDSFGDVISVFTPIP